MPKVKVNDIRINYEIYGDGFPLVMISGLESNISWWGRSLLHKISGHFKVIVFDNRGTGLTNSPDKDFTIKTLVNDTIGLMDTLKINQAHIFSHSMGGRIAQGLVLNYPAKIKKLILCSASCGRSNDIPVSSEVMEILQSFQNGEIIANLIPNAKFIVFENSAHVPYVEERDEFLKALINFLE